jgi:hypothetical protein
VSATRNAGRRGARRCCCVTHRAVCLVRAMGDVPCDGSTSDVRVPTWHPVYRMYDRLKAHVCVVCLCVLQHPHTLAGSARNWRRQKVVCPSKLNAGAQRAAGKPCTFAHACIYFLPFFFSSVPAALLWSAERHSKSQ